MKNSEIIKLAWSMHRGQPREQESGIAMDHLCNIIRKLRKLGQITRDEKVTCMYIIASHLREYAYIFLFEKQHPLYKSEDWEFYKHSEFYLIEKGKWVQSIIDQCEKEENIEESS